MTPEAPFEWTPLTEDELERNAGWGPLIDQAAGGDAVAGLALKRLRAAVVAMEPTIKAAQAEMTRAWTESSAAPNGLTLLLGGEK